MTHDAEITECKTPLSPEMEAYKNYTAAVTALIDINDALRTAGENNSNLIGNRSAHREAYINTTRILSEYFNTYHSKSI